MKTKAHVRFFSRAAHLDTDIEMADVLKIAIGQGALNANGGQLIFDAVNISQHPRLAARASTTNSRKLVATHLRATLCEAFIKNIFEDLVQYFSEILRAAAKNGLDPNRLIGEHKVSLEANQVLLAGNWNAVIDMVSQSVFRKLENERSTKNLINKMNTKLDLGVRQSTIDSALPLLEIRHLLVHFEGKADKIFCNTFPAFGGATVGKKIKLNYTLLQEARTAISNMVNEFDQKIVSKSIVASNEIQP